MKILSILAVLCVVGIADARAQDEPMSASDMMAAFMQYAEPDQHHERLARSVGTWHIEGEFRMGPGDEWQPSTSTAEIEAILGGRFFLQRVTGPAMWEGGHPFEGFGISGYDRIQEKYVSAWADNHGTMMMMGLGTADASGDVITTDITYTNPMTHEPGKSRWIIRYLDADNMVFEMHEQDEGGEFFLAGRLNYARSSGQ